MKYSTPSIEVVTFNPSDAPRIGMQWWVRKDATGVVSLAYIPAGSWTPNAANLVPHTIAEINVLNCSAVQTYRCVAENAPGGYVYGPEHGFEDAFMMVGDDGRSC